MSDPRTLGPWLRRFLAEHIVTERNLARNTQKSYRDTFALLLPFVGTRTHKPVDRLAVQDLTARRVLQFLAHLEDDRGCSVQTRNQRLTAIRAFARFVASRDPGHLEWSTNIRAIALKKAPPQPIGWGSLCRRSWATSVDCGQEYLRRPRDHRGLARTRGTSLRDRRNRQRAGASRTASDPAPAASAARLPPVGRRHSHTASLHMLQGATRSRADPH